eukprot:gb/GECG01003167.1/.p1 GENE.gb/GECG01003167.1/~~gb/GECG01003167.1/.p1  ORF type:complete len:279 (+),score=65.52 gb/GECG01003167.1/:1-837(+)
MAASSNNKGEESTMSESQADRQLRQMMDFLRLEGKEKANEIRTKAEHDYNMEKQVRVQNEKAKMREKFRQLEQERLTEQRVLASKEASKQKGRILQEQEELLKQLNQDVVDELSSWSQRNPEEYKELMKSLIKQGIRRVTLREQGAHNVSIKCRKKDVQITEAATKQALEEFHKEQKEHEKAAYDKAKARGGRFDKPMQLEVKASVKKDDHVPEDNAGGAIVSAHHDTVVCDNTLGKRLTIAEYTLTPQLRYILFPSIRPREPARSKSQSEDTPDLLA